MKRQTLKNGENEAQPTSLYVNTFNSPKTDGKVGNWKVASSDRNLPRHSALAEGGISLNNSVALVGDSGAYRVFSG